MKKIFFWLIVALTVYGASVTIIFGLIALINPSLISTSKTMNQAALFFAHHFAGRNFIIALMMLLPLDLKENKLLALALFLRGLLEGYDGVFEIIEINAAFPGSIFLIFAVLFTISAIYFIC